MEKTLTIDGREVRFKATAGLSYRYFNQFGTEYISDLAKLQEFYETAKIKEIEIELKSLNDNLLKKTFVL